jgi:hypothetical protein
MVRLKRNSNINRNRNSYNCSQQSRDEHRTFKTSKNFQQRWTLDCRKTVKLSEIEIPTIVHSKADEHRTFKTSKNFQQRWTLDFKKTVKLSAEMDV